MELRLIQMIAILFRHIKDQVEPEFPKLGLLIMVVRVPLETARASGQALRRLGGQAGRVPTLPRKLIFSKG